jgi:hypothetical protein
MLSILMVVIFGLSRSLKKALEYLTCKYPPLFLRHGRFRGQRPQLQTLSRRLLVNDQMPARET